jgi:hypothetical protein
MSKIKICQRLVLSKILTQEDSNANASPGDAHEDGARADRARGEGKGSFARGGRTAAGRRREAGVDGQEAAQQHHDREHRVVGPRHAGHHALASEKISVLRLTVRLPPPPREQKLVPVASLFLLSARLIFGQQSTRNNQPCQECGN